MLLRTQNIPALILALGLASACSSLDVRSVDNGNSVVHYPGDGGVVISNIRYGGKAICVAPPAQGALLRQTEVKKRGKVGVTDYVEVESEFDHSTIETLARLYEQNERTLFLQYSLYRLCEAYMNGMLTPTSAAWILREQASKQQETVLFLSEQEMECEGKLDDLNAQITAEKASGPKSDEELRKLERRRDRLKCQLLTAEKDVAKKKARALEKSAAAAESSSATYDARSLYWDGFSLIMQTAVDLAKVDAEQEKLRAETQAAIAEKKTKEAEEKAKTADAKAKAATETLEALRTKALEDTLERAKCRDCKDENKDEKPAKNGQADGSGKTND